MAEKCQHPHALALANLAAGIQAYNRGMFTAARDNCAIAENILRERCTGVTWEITNARLFGALGAMFLGDFNDLRKRLLGPLRESKERGDRYAYTNLATSVGYVLWIADGDVTGAHEQVEECMAEWSQQGFHIQHFMAMIARIQIAICRGDIDLAVRLADEGWPDLERSQLLRTQAVSIFTRWFRSRAYVLKALREPEARARLLKVVTADAKIIEKQASVISPAIASIVRAEAFYVRGDREATLNEIERARSLVVDHKMRVVGLSLDAAVASITAGAQVKERLEKIYTSARELGIANPRALLRFYWPFDVEDPADAMPKAKS